MHFLSASLLRKRHVGKELITSTVLVRALQQRSEKETVPVPVVFTKSTPDREESGFLPRSSSLSGTAESVEEDDEDDNAYRDAIGGI